MKTELTDRQQEILDFIKLFKQKHGYPPTRAEIAAGFEFNASAAEQHVRAIAKKGWLSLPPGISRGIVVLP